MSNNKHMSNTCGCGHHHHEKKECECEHHHKVEECGCGNHREAETHEHRKNHIHKKHAIQRIYIIEHLGCANCAAKMEKKIQELTEVEEASITFATKQLRVLFNTQKDMLPVLQKICSSIEPEVILHLKEKPINNNNHKKKKDIIEIGVALGIFLVGMIGKTSFTWIPFLCFSVAYVLLGREVLITAAKNVRNKEIFDEKFLMSIATLMAFLIGEFPEGVGIMLFFRVGQLFEETAVDRSREEIKKTLDTCPEKINVIKENALVEVYVEDICVGETILIRPGERIPLDGIVVEGTSRIDTSTVTGEAIPAKAEKGDVVLSGCLNLSGMLKVCVEKNVQDSMVTRIINAVENAAAQKPKMDRFITRFAKWYTPCVVGCAVLTAIIPSMITGDWNKWIYTAITFLVISCPCALVLSVPLTFFAGIGAASKKGILFKGGLAIETMQQVKAVIFDKTGTITKGEFVVQKCIPSEGYRESEVLKAAAICEWGSTHPIAESILNEMQHRGWSVEAPEKVEEYAGKGICTVVNNKKILCGNEKLLKQYGIEIKAAEHKICRTEVYVAYDGKFMGSILISDSLKDDAKESISKIKAQGIKTFILTGDTLESTETIANEVMIDNFYAKLLPEDKLACMKEIRKQEGTTMFVGDGINDAPVLAGADVGAAMGNGTDAAIEAADVVFITSSVKSVYEAINISKAIRRIAVQNIVFALSAKIGIMIWGLLGGANMWMAVFADTGVAMLCVLNAVRILLRK